MYPEQREPLRRASRLALRAFAAIFGILVFSIFCLAAKDFVMPTAQPAKTYPAHDQHTDEGLTVALDPYDAPEKTNIFSVPYREIGMLPILLIVTNDGNQPVSLVGMKPELVTADRVKLSPAGPDDIERRLSHPSASATRNPLPFPTKRVKGGVSQQAREEILNARFGAKAVEPHSTQAGFLFFDVQGISRPLQGAHFYVTGVRNAQGNELMYFEVPLDNHQNPPTNP